jgi:hypothetical protein
VELVRARELLVSVTGRSRTSSLGPPQELRRMAARRPRARWMGRNERKTVIRQVR